MSKEANKSSKPSDIVGCMGLYKTHPFPDEQGEHAKLYGTTQDDQERCAAGTRSINTHKDDETT